MNFFRKTLFWIITLLLMLGMFHMIDSRHEEKQLAEELATELFPFPPESVTSFWIEDPAGLRVRAARDNTGGWRLEAPLAAPGDQEGIGKLLDLVVKGKKDGILFDNPNAAKLEELGLQTPRLRMGLSTQKQNVEILFGDAGPTNNVTYAMFRGDKRVFRIHTDIRAGVDIRHDALRDKSVLLFDPVKLARMELVRQQKDRVVITNDRGRWDMLEPVVAHAAMDKVLETLYSVRNTRIKAFVEEKPADLKVYGLDAPRIRLTLREQGGDGEKYLLVGNRDANQRGYLALRSGAENVILLEEGVVHALMSEASSWRTPQGSEP